MTRIFRWLLRIVSGAILLGVLAAALIYWLASRSLPDYSVDLDVTGLQAPVELVRDNASVPHIFGQTDEDVYYALGFAHAQDRLWQMVTLRRTVKGKLSEMFGVRTLQTDALMRRLDLYTAAQQSVEDLSEETRAALKAYSAGVNAWMQQVNDGALGRGAPEFFMFSNEITPWVPADSVAMLKLMAFQLTGQMHSEILRAQTSLLLPDARVRDILPDAPGAGVAALPRYASLFPDATMPAHSQFAAWQAGPMSPVNRPPLAGASNAWAAAPSRSAAGSTLLANDPHLPFAAPGLWYLARLELESGGVIGATIPGIPAVLSGRSESVGWGLTVAYIDDQDLYIEKVNPDVRGEVLTPEGYKPLRKRQSIIQIKDADPITLTLQWSENGPVLPGDMFDLGAITPPGHIVSLAWTALSEDDTTMDGVLGLMHAQSVAEGINAGRAVVAPGVNITLADAGAVGLKTLGAMPRRDPAHQSKGRMPTPGWLPENRWQGMLGYAANPEFLAPEGGILGNTNNKTIDRPFPLHVSYDWGDSQRIQRWQRLMQNREVHTRESFVEAQLDTVSPAARSLLPLIAADLWFTGEAAPDGTPERQRQRALNLLAEWNGEMSEHLPEPLIYAAWVRALQDRLIRDDLGPLARRFTHVEPLFIERVFRDVDGASAWCDVLQSTARETCADVARQSLDDALIWIGETYGTALESLRWGDAHQATHDHPVLGDVPVLKWFVNIRQSTSGGDNTLMRGVTSGDPAHPFENVHGAGYRGVYDFADPDSSIFITATGQSGHFLSRHYDDLGELWRRGEYVPMSLDPDLARAAAVGITHLTPRGQ